MPRCEPWDVAGCTRTHGTRRNDRGKHQPEAGGAATFLDASRGGKRVTVPGDASPMSIGLVTNIDGWVAFFVRPSSRAVSSIGSDGRSGPRISTEPVGPCVRCLGVRELRGELGELNARARFLLLWKRRPLGR